MAELKAHAAELDPKFRYLLEAPETDPQGRPAIVRFSRKGGEQYVTSEENGKATRWRALYRDGRWVEPDPGTVRQTAGKAAKATSRGRTRREVA